MDSAPDKDQTDPLRALPEERQAAKRVKTGAQTGAFASDSGQQAQAQMSRGKDQVPPKLGAHVDPQYAAKVDALYQKIADAPDRYGAEYWFFKLKVTLPNGRDKNGAWYEMHSEQMRAFTAHENNIYTYLWDSARNSQKTSGTTTFHLSDRYILESKLWARQWNVTTLESIRLSPEYRYWVKACDLAVATHVGDAAVASKSAVRKYVMKNPKHYGIGERR